jgi:AcrR family transcriptional regulator
VAAPAPKTDRRRPQQTRSRGTVEALLEAATRVFRREGWKATTNRIATEAGVSVGSLYEYFPNKRALLEALAQRHVEVAEALLAEVLEQPRSITELLEALQRAVLESQRYPSEAIALVGADAGAGLGARAERLRQRALGAITRELERSGHSPSQANLRARAAFGAIGDLSVQALLREPGEHAALAAELLTMAQRHCEAGGPEPPAPGFEKC